MIHRRKKQIILSWLFVALAIAANNADAQSTDTSDNMIIHILNNKILTFTKTDSGDFFRFVGDVVMQQGTDTLYCDSLYQNKTTNILEAFSHVRIAQIDGTQGLCDYLRYTSGDKLAFMQGHVSLTDGKNKLWCEQLTYNLGTKVGVYNEKGTLVADSTLVTSQKGIYNVKTKEARFAGHVIVTDPQYYTSSEDLGYNTETKATQFFAPSVVTGDSNRTILQTSNGIYDSHSGIADLYAHSSVWYDGYYLEADTIHYSKITGYGYAYGSVIGIDTGHHTTLYCGRATYNKRKRILWALEKPVLVQANGRDTLYMRADTFYSAPMVTTADKKKPRLGTLVANGKTPASTTDVASENAASPPLPPAGHPSRSERLNRRFPARMAPIDSVAPIPIAKGMADTGIAPGNSGMPLDAHTENARWDSTKSAGNGKQETPGRKHRAKKEKTSGPGQVVVDTALADTSAPLYFTGYHHVRIFSDSMQGVCDSIVYTQADSTIRMIYSPILWSRNSQVTGDTILMLLDSNQIKSVYVPNNAFTVSLAGPPKAELYDQVQGKTLRAFFKNNTITHLVVMPNAEAIYYPKDDSGAFIGASQASSERMRIYFDDQKIKSIKFEQDVHQSITPLEKADLPNLRLSRFKWLIDQRPKDKEELFR